MIVIEGRENSGNGSGQISIKEKTNPIQFTFSCVEDEPEAIFSNGLFLGCVIE